MEEFPAPASQVEAHNGSRHDRVDRKTIGLALRIDDERYYAVVLEKFSAGEGKGYPDAPDGAHVRILISERNPERSWGHSWMVVDEAGNITFTPPAKTRAATELFGDMDSTSRAIKMFDIFDSAEPATDKERFQAPIGHLSGQGVPLG